MAPLLGQHESELAMAPGVGRVDLEELSDDRLGCGRAAIAQAIRSGCLVQRVIVRKPFAGAGKMVDRGAAALGLGEQLRDGPIGVQGPGLGHEHLPPELERTGQVAAHRREVCGGAQPIAAPAAALGLVKRSAPARIRRARRAIRQGRAAGSPSAGRSRTASSRTSKASGTPLEL